MELTHRKSVWLMKRIVFLVIVFSAISYCVNAQPAELMIKKSAQGLYLNHTVAPKEGLYAIGRLYNVNPKFIAIYNHVSLDAGLAIGQVLHIPLTDTNFSQGSFTGTPVYYVVGSGDNLSKISNSTNNISLQKLKEWNGLQTDNVSPGKKLIVGFLNSKEMTAVAINNSVKKQSTVAEPIHKSDKAAIEEKTNVTKQNQNDAVKNAVVPDNRQSETAVRMDPVSAVNRQPAGQEATEQGYFKTTFDIQAKRNPVSKNETVTSGIFKTNSGWQDAKYYLLIDKIPTGTIVKVINPANNKAVYAKVLGEMNGIRQNEGLDIRISNAAASSLGVSDTEKFIVKVNY